MQVIDWLTVLLVIAVAVFATARYMRRATPHPHFAATDTPPGTGAATDLYAALELLEPRLHQCAHPKDLLDMPEFEAVVEMLCEQDRTATQVAQYVGGDNVTLACAAAEALCRRGDDPDLTDELLQKLGRSAPWADWFALRYLDTRASRPVAGEVFIKSQDLWLHYGAMRDYFNAFLDARRRSEGEPSFAELLDDCSAERLEELTPYLQSLRPDLAAPLLEQLEHWRREHVDLEYLKSVGRVWSADEQPADIVTHAALAQGVELLARALAQTPPRTTIVVGEPGVGKSVLIRHWCRRMQQQGWHILEATAANVIAGQVYLGELEGRVKQLVDNLGARKRVLWYVPSFHELYFSGRHHYSETGVLDILLPYLENGAISLIGESALDAYDRLLQARPQLSAIVDTMRLPPAGDQESLDLALQWAQRQLRAGGGAYLAPDLVRECHRLARHHLRDRAAPGNTFRLLRAVLERHRASANTRAVELNDVLATFTRPA